ncbi:MAG: histidine kinase [Alteripontixanthobacter sp.]
MLSTALSPQAPARLPLRVVVASMVVMWGTYFLLATIRGAIVGLELEPEMLWRRALVCIAGIAVTFVLWLVLRLFEQGQTWAKVAAALVFALPASVLIAQINQWVFADIRDKVEQQVSEQQGFKIRRDESGNLLVDIPYSRFETVDGEAPRPQAEEDGLTLTLKSDPQESWRPVIDIALGRYFLLLAWASLYLALLAGAQARAAERREQQFRSAAKAAELRSLRYQVNPHFLFNTLNSLSSLVMTGKTDRAEEMIQSISRFYRHSLTDDPTQDVPLQQEFELQRHYLEIEGARFPDRLRTRYDLPRDLEEARVPGMILQPLVENSVKYAVATSTRPATITLAAREEFGRLVVTVSDDGPGVPAGTGHGFGIGLANVRDRLQARFGREAQVVSEPREEKHGGGYVTELRMPLVKHGL